jgi:thiamine kinase-like enzyme
VARNSAETAAAVGEVLSELHQFALPWSRTLLAQHPTARGIHWIALEGAAREAACAWADRLEECLAVIHQLELLVTRSWRVDELIGSHRDLHPTNLLRLHPGALALVDWDAAGPVIPEHEVACFALVFGESSDRQHYDQTIVSAFVEGYRHAGGRFRFSGPSDLRMHLQGRLWWTEQNIRVALDNPADELQNRLTDALLADLVQLEERLPTMLQALERASN